MTILADIETLVGAEASTTQQGGDDDNWPCEILTSGVDSWSAVTTLLTLPADDEDLSMTLTSGETCSVYGFPSENTVVVLYDNGEDSWMHCCVYEDSTGYEAGLEVMTPPMSIRV